MMGDIVKDLLQENDLTLAKTVTICQSQEAVKKNHCNIHTVDSSGYAKVQTTACSNSTWLSRTVVKCPAYNQVCMSCHKVGYFVKMSHSRLVRQLLSNVPPTLQLTPIPVSGSHAKPGTNALYMLIQANSQSHLQETITEPPPRVTVSISSTMGTPLVEGTAKLRSIHLCRSSAPWDITMSPQRQLMF